MSNVMQIAVDHRARLEAEVAKIEKFLSFADMLTQHGEQPITDLPLESCESVAQAGDRVEMFKSEPVAPEAEPGGEKEELTLSEPSPAETAAPAAPVAKPEAAPEPQPEAPKAEMSAEAPQAPAAEAAPEKTEEKSEASSLQDSLDALKRALKQ